MRERYPIRSTQVRKEVGEDANVGPIIECDLIRVCSGVDKATVEQNFAGAYDTVWSSA